MIKILRKCLILTIIAISFLFFLRLDGHYFCVQAQTSTPSSELSPTSSPTSSPDTSSQEKLKDLQNQIKELEGKISDLQSQQKTLSSQIAVMNNQIKLTELRINAVKQELKELIADIQTTTKKIVNLEESLDDLTRILLNRIVVTYEAGSIQPLQILLSSGSVSDFFSRANYLRIAQRHDKELVFETQQAKNDYTNQKEIFEGKKAKVEALKKQLESYTNQLAQEKKGKQQLLDVTKNSEKNYQDMLARARAEYEAIQGIIAGKGTEIEVKEIREGDGIASIISGQSACSTGTHLHFEVSNGGANTNPAGYLASKDIEWDLCGWYGCDSPFSFNGSWQWPINNRPRITQGYGMTAYAKSGAYNGGPHTGIDMVSDDLMVKAVQAGTLYQGSIACGKGLLRYVKVDHKDSGIDAYYLHVNYTF